MASPIQAHGKESSRKIRIQSFVACPDHAGQAGAQARQHILASWLFQQASALRNARRPSNQTAQIAMEATTCLHKPRLLHANSQGTYSKKDEALNNSYHDWGSSVRRVRFGRRNLRYTRTADLASPLSYRILGSYQGNFGPTDSERKPDRGIPIHAGVRWIVHAPAEYAIRLQTTQRLPFANSRHFHSATCDLLLDNSHQCKDRRLNDTSHQ